MKLNWNDLQIFLAIARNGSLTGAAAHLSISQPTVSRRLTAMENLLGTKLFDRSQQGYQLSGPGAEIYDSANRVGEDISEIERRLTGHDRSLTGPISITCTEVMSSQYLAPHLSRFAAQSPSIDLSINCTFTNLSLSRGEADVAIRNTGQPPETLIGRRLVKVATAIYSARDNHRWRANKPEDWSWVGWRDDAYTRLLITSRFPSARIRHRVDDMQTMRTLARHGLGVAALPCYLADRDPGLVRVQPEPILKDALDLWILRHPDVRQVTRLRLITEFLAEAILADRDLFEGERPFQIA